jgi:predicted nucleic acid-binding protein
MKYLTDSSALIRIQRRQVDPVWHDLVVAATAMRMKLIVLHEDADFETVARFVPELKQHRVSAGP